LVNPGLYFGEVLVFLANVVFFGEIDKIDYWLGGEEKKIINDFNLVMLVQLLKAMWERICK
jgi:hypothetical protein